MLLVIMNHSASLDTQQSLDSSALRSRQAYTCSEHPNKEAFCICAKCGTCLCRDCAIKIDDRRYCPACTLNDERLQKNLERELFAPQPSEMPAMEPVKHWRQVPGALLDMLRDSNLFFSTAHKSSYPISFVLAYVSLLPNALIVYVFKYQTIMEQLSKSKGNIPEQVQAFIDATQNVPMGTFVAAAFLSVLFKILLLDLAMFASMRVFTRTTISWSEISAMTHFCLIPLGFTAFATGFNLPVIGYIALGIMIIQASTAIRSATNCSFLQGLGAMLAFIFLSTMSRVIYI